MDKVRAAIVGCGRVSRFHAAAYQKLGNAQLVGGADIDPERRKWFSENYSAPAYSSLDELLRNQDVDLISLSVPSDLHFSLAMRILEKGKNVIIEKPVCMTAEEGQQLLEAERKSGKVVSTCFQNRFNPPIKLLVDFINSGEMGKILLGNVCVRWWRTENYFTNHWHASKNRSGGGALMTQAIHHADLLRWLMGEPESITGFRSNLRPYSEVEDVVVAVMKYQNSLSTLEVSTVAYPKDIEASITIIGEKGTVKVGGKSLNRIEYGFVGDKVLTGLADNDDPVSVYGTSHILEIEDVVNSIIEKRPPKVRLEDGVKSLNFVNRIYDSTQIAQNLTLPSIQVPPPVFV
jgi:predicted dehydrogenase